MGQKINPLSFRSTEKLNLQNFLWATKFTNSNYALLNLQDSEIEQLIINFFIDLIISIFINIHHKYCLK